MTPQKSPQGHIHCHPPPIPCAAAHPATHSISRKTQKRINILQLLSTFLWHLLSRSLLTSVKQFSRHLTLIEMAYKMFVIRKISHKNIIQARSSKRKKNSTYLLFKLKLKRKLTTKEPTTIPENIAYACSVNKTKRDTLVWFWPVKDCKTLHPIIWFKCEKNSTVHTSKKNVTKTQLKKKKKKRTTRTGIIFGANLPARFDWSIMGCTILRLALMNLRRGKKEEKWD